MNLIDWLKSGWLIEHTTSPQEIADLLGVADRDIADCKAPGLSPDWKLNIAYNAATSVCNSSSCRLGIPAIPGCASLQSDSVTCLYH